MTVKPLILSMGDPAGVGPELCLRAGSWCRERHLPLVISGSATVLREVSSRLSLPLPACFQPADWDLAVSAAAGVSIVDLEQPIGRVSPGQVNAQTGAASLAYVEYAIERTLQGQAAGVVTCPIHKEAWHAAGCPFPGHTELLAARAGAERHCMMLAAPEIRCALVTVHVGLAEVAELLSVRGVLETIELAGAAVGRMLGRPPVITVLGLNPHAGEGGLFGNREEERLIIPAIDRARAAGWQIRGPLPPDTAFLPRIRQETDVFICMYHDQGLIPLKAIAFDDAVNVTLGLSIVRTSVDHGTALDLAWQGKAFPSSLYAALTMAAQLSEIWTEPMTPGATNHVAKN